MNFSRQRPLKAVFIAQVIGPRDPISAALQDTYRLLSAEPDIEVAAMTMKEISAMIKKSRRPIRD
jgi:hypothetical protein